MAFDMGVKVNDLDPIDRIDSIVRTHESNMKDLVDDADQNIEAIRDKAEAAMRELEIRTNSHISCIWNQIQR